jgi:hypothetical protein
MVWGTLEVVGAAAVTDNFSRADVGEVEGVEEQHDVLASKIGKFECGEGVVWHDCECREFRGKLSRGDRQCHCEQCQKEAKIFHIFMLLIQIQQMFVWSEDVLSEGYLGFNGPKVLGWSCRSMVDRKITGLEVAGSSPVTITFLLKYAKTLLLLMGFRLFNKKLRKDQL